MKNQRGEIVTILTLLSLGLMLAGIVVGKIAVSQPTQTQSKAYIDKLGDANPTAGEAVKEPGSTEGPPDLNVPTAVPATDVPAATAVPDTPEPKPTDDDIPPTSKPARPTDQPTPEPTQPPRLTPLPGHSIIDCGGPQNQCDPSTDNPKTCGNDGCLHAAVGRPTSAPTLAPPTGQIFPTLPGRKPTDCGGTFYQCSNPGSGSCGNDGCDNDKLGRSYEHPVPIPTEFINTKPLPGHKPSDCKGAYYQCIPGTTDCGADGCNDRLLGRGKYKNNYKPTPSPNTTPAAPTPTKIIDESDCDDITKYWTPDGTAPIPNLNNSKCYICEDAGLNGTWKEVGIQRCYLSPTPAAPTPKVIPIIGSPCNQDEKDIKTDNNICYYCVYVGNNRFEWKGGEECVYVPPMIDLPDQCKNNDRKKIVIDNKCYYCSVINGVAFEYPMTQCTTSSTSVTSRDLQAGILISNQRIFPTAYGWGQVQALAVAGKVKATDVSAWVYEAAKYYYPGVKMKFCEPSRGECDFRL